MIAAICYREGLIYASPFGLWLQSKEGEADAGEQQAMEEGEDDDGVEDIMQNPDFIRSVLSSLPGVNTEEAIQNLEQMEEMEKKAKKVNRRMEGKGTTQG